MVYFSQMNFDIFPSKVEILSYSDKSKTLFINVTLSYQIHKTLIWKSKSAPPEYSNMAPCTFYWNTTICKLGWYIQAKISITWQIVYITARGFIKTDRQLMGSKRTNEESISQYIRPYSLFRVSITLLCLPPPQFLSTRYVLIILERSTDMCLSINKQCQADWHWIAHNACLLIWWNIYV